MDYSDYCYNLLQIVLLFRASVFEHWKCLKHFTWTGYRPISQPPTWRTSSFVSGFPSPRLVDDTTSSGWSSWLSTRVSSLVFGNFPRMLYCKATLRNDHPSTSTLSCRLCLVLNRRVTPYSFAAICGSFAIHYLQTSAEELALYCRKKRKNIFFEDYLGTFFCGIINRHLKQNRHKFNTL